MTNKGKFHFSASAALLRELGERLVGSPALAVGELIKNAYDADATKVSVRFEKNSLIVEDNGSGMTISEFRDYWMKVGSPHKQKSLSSPKYKRPLTGSKGVGRLAVQYLGRTLKLSTTSRRENRELFVEIDWDDAIESEDLQEAEADFEYRDDGFEYLGSKSGFRLEIGGLIHSWDSQRQFKDLARDIWKLSPPLRADNVDRLGTFSVDLEGVSPGAAESFSNVMNILDSVWHARITGRLVESRPSDLDKSRRLHLKIEFQNPRGKISKEFLLEDCHLGYVQFDILIFDFVGRQPLGIKVRELREYMDHHGGVRIFDSGFGLSSYGLETDWLNIEEDHSHRLSKSKLLPSSLQETDGMNNLPTQTRMLGEVHIDTGQEFRSRGDISSPDEILSIAVTRDRLLNNSAYKSLAKTVRIGIDLYAMEQTRRRLRQASKSLERIESSGTVTVDSVLKLVREAQDVIPEPVYGAVHRQLMKVAKAEGARSEIIRQEQSLLGALATAGISAIAFEHEAVKQYRKLSRIATQLKRLARDNDLDELNHVAANIKTWVQHSQDTRAIFAPLMDEENRLERVSMKAHSLLEETISQSRVYLRGIKPDLEGLSSSLKLPIGTYAEWSSVFQNLLINAANAVANSETKTISISSYADENTGQIFVQDVGVGVNLETAEELFEPFVRRVSLSDSRRALGAGGAGMGLAIVRLLCGGLGVDCNFVEPDDGFKTCVMVSWER